MSAFDVVVIGGGPAGMMAAARAAQYGASVALIEKNEELGKKLMLTGRGRCNFAHDQAEPEPLAQEYRRGGGFLLPALRKFGTEEAVAFFLRRGVIPSRERGRRIYPKDGQDASTLVNALWTALKDGAVRVIRGEEVRALDFLGKKARRATTRREEIEGRAFILATGGLSFPNTGSTGDGYRWARKAGHSLAEPCPSLCPIKIRENFDESLTGLKLKNVKVILTQDNETVADRFGEMDFTPFGISGAVIMDLASTVGECLKKSADVTIHIDLKPALDPERFDARIGRDFEEFKGDALRFALRKMLPGEIIPEVLKMARLDMGKPCGETTPEERLILRQTMKDFRVTPTELLGFRHAIVTAGGVNTDEIDPETMASKIIPNLYFAGEMIDIDGPTGGYNLQECWSTGFVAGSSAAESLGFAVPSDEDIVRQMVEARNRRDKRERDERREEQSQDMSAIKTGPADNKEFCGWRDPRAAADASQSMTPQAFSDGSEELPADDVTDVSEAPRAKYKEVGTSRPRSSRPLNRDDKPRYDRPRDDRPFNRDDKPRYDRPRYDRPFNRDDKPRYDRPRDDRPFNRDDKPRYDRPRDDRPFNREDKPRYDRPRGDRPFNHDDRPRGDRPFNRDDRPRGDRPFNRDDRPRGDRPFNRDDRPRDDRPFNRDDRPRGDRPFNRDDRPRGDRPFNRDDRPRGDRPFNRDDRSRGDRPFNRDDRPRGDRPFNRDSRPANRDFHAAESSQPRKARSFTSFQNFKAPKVPEDDEQ